MPKLQLDFIGLRQGIRLRCRDRLLATDFDLARQSTERSREVAQLTFDLRQERPSLELRLAARGFFQQRRGLLQVTLARLDDAQQETQARNLWCEARLHARLLGNANYWGRIGE